MSMNGLISTWKAKLLTSLQLFASMYKDVDAVTDHPAGFWYEEILQAFPDAKVILNVRDSEDVWLKSQVRENDVNMYLNAGFLVRWLMRNWSHRKYYALLDCANVAAVGSFYKQNLLFCSGKNIASTIIWTSADRHSKGAALGVQRETRLGTFVHVSWMWGPSRKLFFGWIEDKEAPCER